MTNGSRLSIGLFAGAQSETFDELRDAILSGEYINWDNQGHPPTPQELRAKGGLLTMHRSSGRPAMRAGAPADYPDQWYVQNPTLLRAELVAMGRFHPKARYGFMPQSGDMYWLLELKIGDFCKPWQFLLRYRKDHPNHRYGESV